MMESLPFPPYDTLFISAMHSRSSSWNIMLNSMCVVFNYLFYNPTDLHTTMSSDGVLDICLTDWEHGMEHPPTSSFPILECSSKFVKLGPRNMS